MDKNVLHICNYASPYRGNFIESLEFLSERLKKNGIEQIYVFPYRANSTDAKKWIDELRSNGRIVYIMEKSNLMNIRLLKGLVKKHNIGTIFRHFSDTRTDIMVRMIKGNRKVVHFFHCIYELSPESAKHRLLAFLYKGDTLVGVSNAVTDKLRIAFKNENICTIRNAIYFKRLDKVHDFPESDQISCLVMGYNYKVKGVDLALKAVNELHEKYNIKLFIPVASHGNELIDGIMQIFGQKPDWIEILPPTNEVGTYYRNTDIFLSASRSEGFCYAIVEAAYCGATIVASKIPAQLLFDIDEIYWFESENVPDFCKALEAAINNLGNEKLIEKKKQISKNIEKEFSLESWAKKVEELIVK